MITYAEAFRRVFGFGFFRRESDSASLAAADGAEGARSPFLFLRFLRGNDATATLVIITAIGFVASVLFNLGFVAPWDPEALWLFTPGDFTTLAVPLMLFVAILQLFFATAIGIGVLSLVTIFAFITVMGRSVLNIFGGGEEATSAAPRTGFGAVVDRTAVYLVFIILSLAAGYFGITRISTFLVGVPQDPISSSTEAFLAFFAYLLALAFLMPAVVSFGRAMIRSIAPGWRNTHDVKQNSHFAFSYLESTLPWVLISALVAALYAFVVAGASLFHWKNFDLLDNAAGCAHEQGHASISSKCHLRAVERGVFHYSSDESAILFEFFENDQVISFEAPTELPWAWCMTQTGIFLESFPIVSQGLEAMRDMNKALEDLPEEERNGAVHCGAQFLTAEQARGFDPNADVQAPSLDIDGPTDADSQASSAEIEDAEASEGGESGEETGAASEAEASDSATEAAGAGVDSIEDAAPAVGDGVPEEGEASSDEGVAVPADAEAN